MGPAADVATSESTDSETSTSRPVNPPPLSPADLKLINCYRRTANHLSVGQIYVLENPLLNERRRPEHMKPGLLGHWWTTHGLNFSDSHMNRVIRNWDLDAIYVMGQGHGGPPAVANALLEGSLALGPLPTEATPN